jgi:hypothetical protein
MVGAVARGFEEGRVEIDLPRLERTPQRAQPERGDEGAHVVRRRRQKRGPLLDDGGGDDGRAAAQLFDHEVGGRLSRDIAFEAAAVARIFAVVERDVRQWDAGEQIAQRAVELLFGQPAQRDGRAAGRRGRR